MALRARGQLRAASRRHERVRLDPARVRGSRAHTRRRSRARSAPTAIASCSSSRRPSPRASGTPSRATSGSRSRRRTSRCSTSRTARPGRAGSPAARLNLTHACVERWADDPAHAGAEAIVCGGRGGRAPARSPTPSSRARSPASPRASRRSACGSGDAVALLHADGARGRDRLLRRRRDRRARRADLLGLLGLGGREPAARTRAPSPLDHRRRLHAPRPARSPAKATADEAVARSPGVRHVVVVRHTGRARRVAGRARRLVARARRGPARDAARDAGRLRAPVHARLHVGHDRPAEGRRPRARRASSSRSRREGRYTGDCQAGRPHPLGDRHGLDHGALAARQRARPRASRRCSTTARPTIPDPGRLWRLAERHRLTFLGVSPTLVRALRQARRRTPSTASTSRRCGCSARPASPGTPSPGCGSSSAVGGAHAADHQHLGRHRGRGLLPRRAALSCRTSPARSGGRSSAWRWTSTTPRDGRCAARSASSSARSRGRA